MNNNLQKNFKNIFIKVEITYYNDIFKFLNYFLK